MKQTLIGRTIKVIQSTNPTLSGVEGKVIDETKNTIKITDNKNREKTLIKNQVTIETGNSTIEGKKLTKRIEERIKNEK